MRKTLCIVLVLLVLAIHAPAFGEEAFRSAKTMGNFSEGYAAFSDENDQWGYIDRQGNVVIAPQYEDGVLFPDGLAPATEEGLSGYIDPAGNEVAPLQYERCSYVYQGRAWVKQNGMYRTA